MAVRLHMKIGIVAETDRLPDSPDTVTVVEPNIGARARTKGNLYLLVTGIGGKRLREATRVVAETVQNEYYYDESAGIAVCLKKAIRSANKRLLHAGRFGVREGEPKPIGLAIAVVRGGELYVTTLGPAEAYLVRQARLLTLPDAEPENGLPNELHAEPEVWRGEMAVGDSLILVSPNVTRILGLSPIQDAAVTLHPQPAVEQIHRQFLAAKGSGSDGMIAVEAQEIPSTQKTRPLKPVWPAEPLAGAPDRSPIPLADTVQDGVLAVQTGARHAQRRAGGAIRNTVDALLDLMPRRRTDGGRVTPLSVQRERQRRAAFALIGFCLVVAMGGLAFYALRNTGSKDQNLDQKQRARQAFTQAEQDISDVFGGGQDLLAVNPERAGGLLKDAYSKLDDAERYGVPKSETQPKREMVIAGLNRYYQVVWLNPKTVVSFGTDTLGDVVLGPDGAAYVLDETAKAVFRVDLVNRTKAPVVSLGDLGGQVATPRLITVGGPDVLVLDSSNRLWRWRPTVGDKTGRGTLVRLRVDAAETWDAAPRGIATYVTNADAGLYALYVVDPKREGVYKYLAAADGSGYPSNSENRYFQVPEKGLETVEDLLIDGSLYLAQNGAIKRYDGGQAVKAWSVRAPADGFLRAGAPQYRRVASPTGKDFGYLYVFDSKNHRVLMYQKDTGDFSKQFMVATAGSPQYPFATATPEATPSPGPSATPSPTRSPSAPAKPPAKGSPTAAATTAPTPVPAASAPPSVDFSSMGGMFILPGDNATVFWTEDGELLSAALNPDAAPAGPTASPSASASPTATASPSKK